MSELQTSIAPVLVPEDVAASAIGESAETRRKRRYEDTRRIERGETIRGPRWVSIGKKPMYRPADLAEYAARLPDCTQ